MTLAPLAPEARVAEHPAVRAAQRVAADVLTPHAAAADDPRQGVEPAHLALLAAGGLLSVRMPVAEGGLGADAAVDAETVELLTGGCTATWFVATQHRTPQYLVRGSLPGLDPDAVVHGPAAERHRAGLTAATTRAGIALAHVRRPGPPAVHAERTASGWTLHGTADWCTGWGLVDLVLLAGTSADGRFVLALVPARERPGMRASVPLPLAVMGGTRTVALELRGLAVADEDVLAVVDAARWTRHDTARTANASPALFGLLRRVLAQLHAVGVQRERPEAVEAAAHLAEEAAGCRTRAYGLLLGTPLFEAVQERTDVRARTCALAVRAANALVAARSGSAMLASSPEQRAVREAAFHLVQAQTEGVRAAQLRALAAGGRP